ncbi:hypothetical protein PTE01_04240 [Pseudoalteromonas tetraodonis GFC]|uniref:DUF4136 domain-containing protein n=1 Tax=Pseudoalteromonas tetraodonis GFC TaxID=1315271 RepID=A0AA37W4L3_9GAMM|nr:DUF4136 domain-containing protein [Pseudoalteromonas tetraodonis]ATD03410.1 hypothetical protein PTET_a2034 [Pseudoalteromonas tetraodonis]GEN37314.1 hypothetical protein PTE01_04240 [Pseudoalteromonas tetraodonis GFC]GLQ03185.1 hypothetical protein GCM10007914_20660 [Pseudoalteromonas tetraodonis GFC]|tara:strand:- start:935 stop:1486 length:552 start_codon:yes stop_codon:yes gene_type:complete
MKHIFIVAALALLTACTQTPDWDYDKSANFSNYKTFAWVENASLTKDTNNYQISGLMEKRVRNAVNNQLSQQLGMQLVDVAQADVLVNYHASVDKELEVDSFNVGYGARWGYWDTGFNHDVSAREYEVGTLVIDIINRESNQLIWRGAKDGRLKKKQTPSQREAAIKETVANILSNFPPKVQQ